MGEAKKYLQEKETQVAFVLDESGSLNGHQDMIISGFNEQLNILREQEKDGGKVTVSLYKFGCRPDSRPRILFKSKDIKAIRDLSRDNYAPFGGTPLYDGIGMALSDLSDLDRDDGVDRAFLVVVFTDGYENASREWSSSQLAERVEALQGRGNWTVAFIGAQVDLQRMSGFATVSFGNMRSFENIGAAVHTSPEMLSNYMTARGMGDTQSVNYCTPDELTSSDS